MEAMGWQEARCLSLLLQCEVVRTTRGNRVLSNISDFKRCLFSDIISDLHGCFFFFSCVFPFECICSVLVCTLTTENVGLND